MAKSDSLFKLIKSMTPTEKRYFKVFTGGGNGQEGHKYHLLFDAIDEQVAKGDNYREQEVLSALKGTLDEGNISFEKNYLYQAIMKSLRYYQSEHSPRTSLKELFIDIYLLYERGLHKDTLKFIRKAKKIAQKHDYHLDYLELSLLERRIKRQTARKDTGKLIRPLQQDCRQKLQQVNSQFNILDLYEEVFINIRNQNMTEEKLSALEQKARQALGGEGTAAYGSFEEQMYYHLTYSMLYLFRKDGPRRMEHLKSLLEYFEAHAFLLDDNQYQKRYLSCLNNYVNHCYLHQSGEELKEQINKLQELRPKSRSLQIQLQQYLYYSKMLYYFKKKEFAEMAALGPDIEGLMARYEQQINLKRRLTFNINLAAAYLLEHEYEKAQDKINLIINEPKFEVRKDIQMLSRLFQIILFFSQELYDSAEYEVFKAQRYLRKFRNNNPTEKRIINAFKKAIQNGRLSALEQLYQELKESQGYEEIQYWLERNI